eukprot:scaffold649988_cov46-Prasinocladus_malaysianus.AAC.1
MKLKQFTLPFSFLAKRNHSCYTANDYTCCCDPREMRCEGFWESGSASALGHWGSDDPAHRPLKHSN